MSENQEWIGVDLDGTLFTYDTWQGWNVFGEPIAPMITRVKQWLDAGKQVRIFTARVRPFNPRTDDVMTETCRVTKERFSNHMMVTAIQNLCEKHLGKRLFVTCVKDANMIELWDDRAVQVIPNKGITLTDAHEAEMSALRGKAFQSSATAVVDEHPSHNVSSSFFACYGCGLPAGHEDLQKPCPTPGQGRTRL